ncbi:ATP-grasp domain-containing protein [Ekhidna sp.]|uniref:ATP-grasp domain-containing protein n=1 Tax=Ekhidna sp. TaxID=2608089 RepID=UPI003299C7B1
MLTEKKYNLVLVPHKESNQRPDFEQIASYIEKNAPDIQVFIVEDIEENKAIDKFLKKEPTLVFSIFRLKHLKQLTGTIYEGSIVSKYEELLMMKRMDLPVPRMALLSVGNKPNLDDFGDYIVMKPARGRQGADVKIVKKSKVKWKKPKTEAASRSHQWILQEFIYTGEWPTSYRVTTLFGKVLFSLKIEANRNKIPLKSRNDFKNGGGTIVSSGKGCSFSLDYDEEIIALGEKAHAAFPLVPLIGCDIVRDVEDGKLYIVEANSMGLVWHFNSPIGRSSQKHSNISFESQFDGINKSAEILIQKTRSLTLS